MRYSKLPQKTTLEILYGVSKQKLLLPSVVQLGLICLVSTRQQNFTFCLVTGCVTHCLIEHLIVSTDSLAAAIVHVTLVRKWREFVWWLRRLFFGLSLQLYALERSLQLFHHISGPFAYEESNGVVCF